MNETLEKMKEAAQRVLTQKGMLRWAGLLGICGVLLLVAAGWLGEEKSAAAAGERQLQEAAEAVLEDRLRPLVAAITGEEDDCILVTVAGDARTVYATQETVGTGDSETSYVIVKNADGSQSAVKLTEICPEVTGVVVATARAEDAFIRERIMAAVTTAFGIPSSRVCVVLSF